jgi:carbamoyltransferase
MNEWFEIDPSVWKSNQSPYMSFTANVRSEKRSEVPSVCHVDASARMQTVSGHKFAAMMLAIILSQSLKVSERDNKLYHRLITAFFGITAVPMVLNTSFNKKGENFNRKKGFLGHNSSISHRYSFSHLIRSH